jgi:hypothetical protein
MTEIQLCETCTTPTLDDDMRDCETRGLSFCDKCWDQHLHECRSCAFEYTDWDAMREA